MEGEEVEGGEEAIEGEGAEEAMEEGDEAAEGEEEKEEETDQKEVEEDEEEEKKEGVEKKERGKKGPGRIDMLQGKSNYYFFHSTNLARDISSCSNYICRRVLVNNVSYVCRKLYLNYRQKIRSKASNCCIGTYHAAGLGE